MALSVEEIKKYIEEPKKVQQKNDDKESTVTVTVTVRTNDTTEAAAEVEVPELSREEIMIRLQEIKTEMKEIRRNKKMDRGKIQNILDKLRNEERTLRLKI